MNASLDQFKRTSNEKFQELRKAIDKSIASMPSLDLERNRKLAMQVSENANELLSYHAQPDRPAWLKTIANAAKAFASSSNPNEARMYSEAIAKNFHLIQPIVLDHSRELDLDAIYQQHSQDGTLQVLFDNVIDCLEQLLDDPDLDTASAIETLERMIELLKSNRKSSVLAKFRALQAVKSTMTVVRDVVCVTALGSNIYDKVNEYFIEAEEQHIALEDGVSKTLLENALNPRVIKKLSAAGADMSKAMTPADVPRLEGPAADPESEIEEAEWSNTPDESDSPHSDV